MRDLLILAIALPAAALALRQPWVGVMLWTWLSIMNPHRYTWGIAYEAPLAAIAAGCTLIGLLMTKERQSPFQGRPITIFFILMCWITISWLGGYDTEGDYAQWSKVMKIDVMTLIAACLLHTRLQIMAFIYITVGSLAILGSKGGIFSILSGGSYRVWGPPESFIYDNNEFALSLIMAIPLLMFLHRTVKKSWQKILFIAVSMLCVASALGSYSRGGFLAIGAMALVLWWRSEKKLPMAIGIILVAVMFLPFMPDAWWARMSTISNYEEDLSAQGRLNGWYVATQVALHNFFGGGMSYQHQIYFNLYGLYNNDTIAAHSIYFQILGNHGFIGLILFMTLWLTTFSWAGWLRKNASSTPDTAWAATLGAMIQVSLVGYAVGGAFLSLAYFDLPYNMMIMVVLARRWVERKAWQTETPMTLREALGLKKRCNHASQPDKGLALKG